MNVCALIQNRKSVREFSDTQVPPDLLQALERYHRDDCRRLVPEIDTELHLLGQEGRAALEGAAGYERFLVGAPCYMLLLTKKHPFAGINAGFIMEDLILKLTELGLDSCFLTFTDSERVKAALNLSTPMEVGAIAAFGYGVKTTKRLRVNILSMSNVDISAQRQYFAPKKAIGDMVFMDAWGRREGVEEQIGFYDDMLWEALYAAAQSPSYLNRQPYGFVIHSGCITLVKAPDGYTGKLDADLGLGIVLLHFTAAAAQWAGTIRWALGEEASAPPLPEGYEAVASCQV